MTSSLCHFLHRHVTLPLLIPNISLGTLLSNTPDCPSLSFTHSVFGLTTKRERTSVHFGVRGPPQFVSYTPVHSCVPEFEFRKEGNEVTRRMCVDLPQNVHKSAAILKITTPSQSTVTSIKHSSYMQQNWGRCKLERQTVYTECASRGNRTYRMVNARTSQCNITAW
jgi:hypothetical protein